jgi:MATE family multidrug resistance protein
MVPLGIGIATSVRVGQAVGRRDRRGIRSAGDAGVGLAALFMLFAAFAFWTFPRIIVGLYIDVGAPSNHSVVALASSLLGIAAVFQIFDGVQVSAAGALRGLKDTRSPMIIGLVSYWAIGLTSGYTFGFWLGYGPPGLWWGLVLGLVAAAWLLAARFRRQAALALVVADEDAAATGEGFLS